MEPQKQNGNGTAMVRAEPAHPAQAGLATSVKIGSMAEVFRLAERLSEARGFVPDHYVGRPVALAAVILTGVELGLGPMQAMREVYIVKGKPSLSATLMMLLARRAGVRIRWPHTDAEKATIAITVPGEAEQSLTFSKADAERAGLWGQGTWKAYPAAMLRARAASAAIKAFCPDVLGGSVYESESGELTGGVPTPDYIDAQIVETKPEAPKVEKRDAVTDTKTPAELRAWCEANADRVKDAGPKGAAKVVKHGAGLGVGELVVRQWLGLPVEDALRPPPDPASGELAEDPPA